MKVDEGRVVALVPHAGAEGAHGPGVGVLLGLLAALVHLGLGAVPHDHSLPVRVAVELEAGLGAGDQLGLQGVVGEGAEVLYPAVVALESSFYLPEGEGEKYEESCVGPHDCGCVTLNQCSLVSGWSGFQLVLWCFYDTGPGDTSQTPTLCNTFNITLPGLSKLQSTIESLLSQSLALRLDGQ